MAGAEDGGGVEVMENHLYLLMWFTGGKNVKGASEPYKKSGVRFGWLVQAYRSGITIIILR